jgi:hypothetical protein
MDYVKSVLNLRYFIEDHLDDDCGTWEYQHAPHIKSIVSSLDANESDFFSRTIWNWPAKVLYELADAILTEENQYLNTSYLYCRIFSLTDDVEDLETLAQNLSACFYSLPTDIIDVKILSAIKTRLIQVLNVTVDKNWEANHKDLLCSI